jgi:hypothetical protein
MLEKAVAEEMDRLRSREARLRQELEAPGRAEASQRALVLKDEAEARKFLRYHAESRTSFHRAYAQLLKTLERDAAEGPAAPVSPNELDEPAEEGPPAEPERCISPNEPSRAPADGQVCDASHCPGEPAVSSPVSCGVEAVALPACLGAA